MKSVAIVGQKEANRRQCCISWCCSST